MQIPWLHPIFPEFPPVETASEEGIIAVGGNLLPSTLINAYKNGIFPWFSEGDPIIWWCPNPRFVLYPSEIHISKSMNKILNQKRFKVTFDTAFKEVITQCQKSYRKGEPGTWITTEMLEAYLTLHKQGIAHSVEVWKDEKLCGGLYGVALGKSFFGESMFSLESNASKTALIVLAKKLQEKGFKVIDCQVYTNHLESMGAKMIPRSEFIHLIHIHLNQNEPNQNWSHWNE